MKIITLNAHTFWPNWTKIVTLNADTKEMSLHIDHWILYQHIN